MILWPPDLRTRVNRKKESMKTSTNKQSSEITQLTPEEFVDHKRPIETIIVRGVGETRIYTTLGFFPPQGPSTFMVGLKSIAIEPLYFTGDPYDHYVGRNAGNEIVFQFLCPYPCEVSYVCEEEQR